MVLTRPRCRQVTTGLAVSALVGCVFAPARVRVELIEEPTTLSPAPRSFSPERPLSADSESIGVCVYPGSGYRVSGRWTVVAPDGHEAQVVARAELVDGQRVKLVSPSSTGRRLCVHPRLGGPLEGAVKRIEVVASVPIVVDRIVWQSTRP